MLYMYVKVFTVGVIIKTISAYLCESSHTPQLQQQQKNIYNWDITGQCVCVCMAEERKTTHEH